MSENTDNTLSAYLGPEFQQRLMWQLLVEPEFAEKTLPTLAIEYFDDPNLKRLYIIILEYFKEFEKVPNLQNQSIFQAIGKYKTPNNNMEEESLLAVIKRIELWNERIINKQLLYDGDVVQKQTNLFIKQQEYRKIAEGIIVKCKNGEIKSKHTVAKIEEDFQKVAHIGDDEDYGIDVFDNIDYALRKEFRQPIATGVRVIDAVTGGGLGKGEIAVILTPSGVGKTTLLTKVANTAYDEGKNVCQIIFEDTKEQIQRKHFTIWAKSALSKMDEEVENLRVNRIAHEKAIEMKAKGGNLIIKKFSQENTTMMDVRKWMINYQKKYGIKFDILILDYLDCLESHKKSPDRNEAELVIIKSFEALASDFDIPAWTAIQTNRSGFNAEYVEAYQTGGSIKRIQKAHLFMSVAKTKDQQEASLANIRIIKARFAKDGQAFDDCIFNNDTMQIIIEDNRYPLQTKGVKHHDTEDINSIDETAKRLLDKSSELGMHAAIMQHTEGSLMSRLNDPSINDEPIDIHQFENIGKKDFENAKIVNMHIETTRTDLSTEEIKTITDIAQDALNETERKTFNDSYNEDILEIEPDKPIENTGGVLLVDQLVSITPQQEPNPNYPITYVYGKPEPDIIGWTGESTTVSENIQEVKLEDIPKEKPITVETVLQKYNEVNKNNRTFTPPPEEKIVDVGAKLLHLAANPIRNIKEAEKTFDDPDSPSIVGNPIFDAINKVMKHQNIVKKE